MSATVHGERRKITTHAVRAYWEKRLLHKDVEAGQCFACQMRSPKRPWLNGFKSASEPVAGDNMARIAEQGARA